MYMDNEEGYDIDVHEVLEDYQWLTTQKNG